MSAGYGTLHRRWCPALENQYQVVPAGKGVVRHEPVGPVFDCLCKHGTIQLTDPRPEVVEAAVARYRERHPEPVAEPERYGLAWRAIEWLKGVLGP